MREAKGFVFGGELLNTPCNFLRTPSSLSEYSFLDSPGTKSVKKAGSMSQSSSPTSDLTGLSGPADCARGTCLSLSCVCIGRDVLRVHYTQCGSKCEMQGKHCPNVYLPNARILSAKHATGHSNTKRLFFVQGFQCCMVRICSYFGCCHRWSVFA